MNLLKSRLGVLIPLVNISLIGYSVPMNKTSSKKTGSQRPNIIFILTDDQSAGALGYAGNRQIHTPEMDRLAREGVYFKNAVATTPISSASRASILTGLYERTHKYTFQTGPVREEYMQESYPKILKESGYYTGFYGKLGVNYDNKGLLFDEYEDYDRDTRYKDRRGFFFKTIGKDTVHLTRYTGEKAINFIDEAPADMPFCLSVSFSAPHAHDPAPDQYFWDEGTDKLYQDIKIPGPDLSEDFYFNALPEAVRKGFNRTRWAWRFDTPEKYQKSMKGYYRMISGVDLEIAKIRQKLKEKGLDKNTVIILMGDNGYFLGERQLADKWLLYDLSVKIPLIIYDPRIKNHRDIDAMALNLDVPSTIADFAGISQPDSWHGKSLVPFVTGKSNTSGRDTVLIEHLWEIESIPPSEGIRTDEWKYLRYVNDKSLEELYNIKADPKEINNLVKRPEYLNTLNVLRTKLDDLAQKFGDPYSGVPSGLTVEYIREPGNVLINDKLPEFSWVVPKEAAIQKGFQILVASDLNAINNNIGDVWNSGQVRGSQSSNIEHKGKTLNPDSKYYWKVRIWDQDNRLTDYSAVQEFKTGSFSGTVSTGNAFQIEEVKPKLIVKTGSDSFFIDFGKDAFGTLVLRYLPVKDDTLYIRLGEKLNGKTIDRIPGGTIRYSEVKLPVQPGKKLYTLKLTPDVRNTIPGKAVSLPDTFDVITPFRYCEIDNYRSDLTDSDIFQKAYFGYFDENNSSFKSSDTTLNQIWDICKYSIKATTFTGLYIDGDRERIPYEADAYINQLGHYNVDNEYAMAKQTIEWFMNKPTWPTEWLLHTAMLVQQDYLYTGDTELLKTYYDLLKKKTLFELCREDGLISTISEKIDGRFMMSIGFSDTTTMLKDIVDWPAGTISSGDKTFNQPGERDSYDMVPVNTVVNCFFYKNMQIMTEFARILGKQNDEAYFELMKVKVKNAINEKLFDTKRGIYIDGEGSAHSSLHANMLPLAFGLVPDANMRSVVDFVKSRGMACSVYGVQYLMEGLYEAEEGQYALDLMRATNDRSWWNMIRSGSTITMEAWDMKYKPNSDWNHAWGAAPANIIPRLLWGITPKEPGFQVIRIKPLLGDLKNSSIVVPTIKGSIKGSYLYVNERNKKYTIELPANVVAEFIIKCSPEEVVTLNGKRLNMAFNTIRLEPGINNIEIVLNSF